MPVESSELCGEWHILESAKFRYFIVISLILHLFLLAVFRVNLHQKVEEFRPTYVRIVELPFFEESEIISKTKPGRGIAKNITGEGSGPPLSGSQRAHESISPSTQETSGIPNEMRKSGSEEVKKSDSQNTPDIAAPARRDSSSRGIRGLPLITDKDLERFAMVEEPYLKKKEKSITLDTDEFKYLSYLERLKNRIEFIWKYPEVARINRLQGDLFIRFSILKNGRLGDAQILRSSGYKMLDDAALQALKGSDPFWPLPENWDLEELTITGHFIYYLGGMYLR